MVDKMSDMAFLVRKCFSLHSGLDNIHYVLAFLVDEKTMEKLNTATSKG